MKSRHSGFSELLTVSIPSIHRVQYSSAGRTGKVSFFDDDDLIEDLSILCKRTARRLGAKLLPFCRSHLCMAVPQRQGGTATHQGNRESNRDLTEWPGCCLEAATTRICLQGHHVEMRTFHWVIVFSKVEHVRRACAPARLRLIDRSDSRRHHKKRRLQLQNGAKFYCRAVLQ